MIFRAGSQRPVILPVCLFDWQVVDAGKTPLHLAVRGKLPVLVAIRAEPVAGIVVLLVREADSDAVVGVRPDFFNQPVVELFCPLPSQECNNLLAAMDELGPVAPETIGCIDKRYLLGIA